MSLMDWLPTFATAAGNPNITKELLAGKELGGKTYKVHLDGYDQTEMLTRGGKSARYAFLVFRANDSGCYQAWRRESIVYFATRGMGWSYREEQLPEDPQSAAGPIRANGLRRRIIYGL